MRPVAKPLTAFFTDKLRFCAVFSLLVLFQELPGSKRDPTDVAGNLLAVLLVHVKLVELQACLVGVVLPAGVTKIVEPEFRLLLRESLLSEVHFPVRDEV